MANVSAIKLPNGNTYTIKDSISGYTTNTGTITKVSTTTGSHSTIDISSGAVSFKVPTKTSHLTNDSGFTTKNIWYATCSTASDTSAKVATTDSQDFVLETGNMVRVNFDNGNISSAISTLNVDGTGAKNIFSRALDFTSQYYWRSGEIVDFVYDGTGFVMSNKSPASTAFYGITKLSSSIASTSEVLAATSKAVKAAYDEAIDATATPTANKKSKFDASAHMNSTDMTTQDVSDFVDGLNVSGAGEQIQTRKLLWTNTTATASLAGQTIPLNLSEYDHVEVWFFQGGDTDALVPNPVKCKIGTSAWAILLHNLYGDGVNENTGARKVHAESTGVAFGNYVYKNRRSGGTLTTANNFLVPHYIYGIKYV